MDAIKTFKLEGLVAATFTPMTKDGEVDYEKFEPYCQHLADNGVSQIYVNGSTGEAFSLTLDERKKVVEKWMEVGKGRIKAMVVQVGTLNLHDTIELVKHAASVGADAISSVPPLFFKPKTLEYLVKYCKEVANAAPDIPFYYYHNPGATAVEPNIEDFLKAASKEIPSLVGVKFSSKDLVDLIGCVNVPAPHRETNTIIFFLGGIVMGADGGIGTTYNFIPKLIQKIMKKAKTGDVCDARGDQYLVQQALRVMYGYGDLLGHALGAFKAVMALIGPDLGPVRPPLRGPTQEELAVLKQELTECGMDQW